MNNEVQNDESMRNRTRDKENPLPDEKEHGAPAQRPERKTVPGSAIFLDDRRFWRRERYFLATESTPFTPESQSTFYDRREHQLYHRTVLLMRADDGTTETVASLDWTSSRVVFRRDTERVWSQVKELVNDGTLGLDQVWSQLASNLRRTTLDNDYEDPAQTVAYVEYLWVPPYYRGRGHGRRLLEMMLRSWYYEWHLDRVELMPDPNATPDQPDGAPDRAALWGLYERVGFRPDRGRTAWQLVAKAFDKGEIHTTGVAGTFDYLQDKLNVKDRKGRLSKRLADFGNDHGKIKSTLDLLHKLSCAVATRADIKSMCADGCEAYMCFDLFRDTLPPHERHGTVPSRSWNTDRITPSFMPWSGGKLEEFLEGIAERLPHHLCRVIPPAPAAPKISVILPTPEEAPGLESHPSTPPLSASTPSTSEDLVEESPEAYVVKTRPQSPEPTPRSAAGSLCLAEAGATVFDILEELERFVQHSRPAALAAPSPQRCAKRSSGIYVDSAATGRVAKKVKI